MKFSDSQKRPVTLICYYIGLFRGHHHLAVGTVVNEAFIRDMDRSRVNHVHSFTTMVIKYKWEVVWKFPTALMESKVSAESSRLPGPTSSPISLRPRCNSTTGDGLVLLLILILEGNGRGRSCQHFLKLSDFVIRVSG